MKKSTSRPKKAAVKRGNIKDNEPEYDPFPKTGLVKEYEPFIRKWVTTFCKAYPAVRRGDTLIEAVKIAIEVESKFKPELGHNFSTFLRWHLKGLKRILVDKERAYSKRLIHVPEGEVSEEIIKQRDAGDMADAEIDRRRLDRVEVGVGSGGNGARVRLDLTGPVIGFQLFDRAWDHALGIADRVSRDLRTLADLISRRSSASDANVAHNERRQREADQEAENQRRGDYSPVFLEARDTLKPDIQFRPPKKAATPRRHKPSEKPDLERLDPILREHHEDREALMAGAVEALRPSLDDRDRAILNWMLKPQDRTLTALASGIDITKGYASKLKGRILNQLAKRMTATPEQLIERGRQILTASGP